MLASVDLKKRENHDDLDFLQMNGYVPCGIYSIKVFFLYQSQVPVDRACSLYLSFLQCYRLLVTQLLSQ